MKRQSKSIPTEPHRLANGEGLQSDEKMEAGKLKPTWTGSLRLVRSSLACRFRARTARRRTGMGLDDLAEKVSV